MKLTNKLEPEIKHVMHDHWESYIKGDLETWATNLVNYYQNTGTTKKEIIDKVFHPFFTTKHPGQGKGLGFSYDTISKVHNKTTLHVKSLENEGTSFSIVLNENT